MYKVDAIKAEMKNGVVKVIVPKVKEEERKDVYQVIVEWWEKFLRGCLLVKVMEVRSRVLVLIVKI